MHSCFTTGYLRYFTRVTCLSLVATVADLLSGSSYCCDAAYSLYLSAMSDMCASPWIHWISYCLLICRKSRRFWIQTLSWIHQHPSIRERVLTVTNTLAKRALRATNTVERKVGPRPSPREIRKAELLHPSPRSRHLSPSWMMRTDVTSASILQRRTGMVNQRVCLYAGSARQKVGVRFICFLLQVLWSLMDRVPEIIRSWNCGPKRKTLHKNLD